MKIPCPHCGYLNINVRGVYSRSFKYSEYQPTECSECGCHYTYKITVEQRVGVPGVGEKSNVRIYTAKEIYE
jgi:hypothetical protein